MALSLPPFALFPAPAAWQDLVSTAEWTTYLESSLFLARAYLSASDTEFETAVLSDESLFRFLLSAVRWLPAAGSPSEPLTLELKQSCFFLAVRGLKMEHGPETILTWGFLSDLCRVYGKRRMGQLLSELSAPSSSLAEASLSGLKKYLARTLDSGLDGDLKGAEERLRRLNYLIGSWPTAAALFLAGSDYLDALISCFKIMNPPLRKCIITNTYLCLLGLTEGRPPKLSQITDVLYSLHSAAQDHKAGPLSQNDSLVVELVTVTPILQQIQRRAEILSAPSNTRLESALKGLAQFRRGCRKPSVPHKRTKQNSSKGKAAVSSWPRDSLQHLHVHQWSQISQIQDLFPDLGSAFVAKLLDEYGDDQEKVVAHLLENDIPGALQSVDRTENLKRGLGKDPRHNDIAPQPKPPLIPEHMDTLDQDRLESLALDTSKLHFGKRESTVTANDVLSDRSAAPTKASILSALAAFDSDDDERDDTYDAADIGGAVDDGAGVDEDLPDAAEEALFRAYQARPELLGRDSGTRQSQDRAQLRDETGMTHEAIEGWGLMLARNPQQRRRLEAKFSTFSGAQTELVTTSWRANGDDGSGTDRTAHVRGGNNGIRRGPRREGRGNNRGGNVAGPSGDRETDNARRRKEASKASRANHNRRDQRARKMAKGGFPG